MAAERKCRADSMDVGREDSLHFDRSQQKQLPVLDKASETEPPPTKRVECQLETSDLLVDQSSQAPQGVFRLKDLPQELRMMVYAHELYHIPGERQPALLRVLAEDEKLSIDDYGRALTLWEYGAMHTFRVSSENLDAYHKMPRLKMLKIRHITIVVDTAAGANDIFRRLASDKAKFENNFESVIVDIGRNFSMRSSRHSYRSRDYLLTWAKYVIGASSRPYRFILRRADGELYKSFPQYDGDDVGISIMPRVKLMIDQEVACLWIWEGGDKLLR